MQKACHTENINHHHMRKSLLLLCYGSSSLSSFYLVYINKPPLPLTVYLQTPLWVFCPSFQKSKSRFGINCNGSKRLQWYPDVESDIPIILKNQQDPKFAKGAAKGIPLATHTWADKSPSYVDIQEDIQSNNFMWADCVKVGNKNSRKATTRREKCHIWRERFLKHKQGLVCEF